MSERTLEPILMRNLATAASHTSTRTELLPARTDVSDPLTLTLNEIPALETSHLHIHEERTPAGANRRVSPVNPHRPRSCCIGDRKLHEDRSQRNMRRRLGRDSPMKARVDRHRYAIAPDETRCGIARMLAWAVLHRLLVDLRVGIQPIEYPGRDIERPHVDGEVRCRERECRLGCLDRLVHVVC